MTIAVGRALLARIVWLCEKPCRMAEGLLWPRGGCGCHDSELGQLELLDRSFILVLASPKLAAWPK